MKDLAWYQEAVIYTVQRLSEIPFDTLGNLIVVGIPVWILLYAWWRKHEQEYQ